MYLGKYTVLIWLFVYSYTSYTSVSTTMSLYYVYIVGVHSMVMLQNINYTCVIYWQIFIGKMRYLPFIKVLNINMWRVILIVTSTKSGAISWLPDRMGEETSDSYNVWKVFFSNQKPDNYICISPLTICQVLKFNNETLRCWRVKYVLSVVLFFLSHESERSCICMLGYPFLPFWYCILVLYSGIVFWKCS